MNLNFFSLLTHFPTFSRHFVCFFQNTDRMLVFFILSDTAIFIDLLFFVFVFKKHQPLSKLVVCGLECGAERFIDGVSSMHACARRLTVWDARPTVLGVGVGAADAVDDQDVVDESESKRESASALRISTSSSSSSSSSLSSSPSSSSSSSSHPRSQFRRVLCSIDDFSSPDSAQQSSVGVHHGDDHNHDVDEDDVNAGMMETGEVDDFASEWADDDQTLVQIYF
jgi:hypothetical protein